MDKEEIEKLHADLLNAWNAQDASKMASLFTDNGTSIGFDGSRYSGRTEIESEIGKIFKHHQTAKYVWKIKAVDFLNAETAVLQSNVGMVPPGQKKINSAANAIQTITAIKQNGVWKIVLFQNTPAQFHGRPHEVEQFTSELNALIKD